MHDMVNVVQYGNKTNQVVSVEDVTTVALADREQRKGLGNYSPFYYGTLACTT